MCWEGDGRPPRDLLAIAVPPRCVLVPKFDGRAETRNAVMPRGAGTVALVAYYKLGLALLRHAWFNLDRVWAVALVLSVIAAVWI
jgi:hypothetical protein